MTCSLLPRKKPPNRQLKNHRKTNLKRKTIGPNRVSRKKLNRNRRPRRKPELKTVNQTTPQTVNQTAPRRMQRPRTLPRHQVLDEKTKGRRPKTRKPTTRPPKLRTMILWQEGRTRDW